MLLLYVIDIKGGGIGAKNRSGVGRFQGRHIA